MKDDVARRKASANAVALRIVQKRLSILLDEIRALRAYVDAD